MRRHVRRMRVDETGRLEIVDPGLDDLALLCDVDPDFAVVNAPLPGFHRPRLLSLRSVMTSLSGRTAAELPMESLWAAHDQAMAQWRSGRGAPPGSGISLLALKAVMARRLLGACVLCARRCGIDRIAGKVGPCGLKTEAFVADHFVHIGEEPAINPSLALNLRGCALRCRGCQQHELLDPRGADGERLDENLWRQLDFAEARSLSFIGGNPDESLPAILDFLLGAPEGFALPIVWNNHAYMTPEVTQLLQCVIDCYVPDLKFHQPGCALAYTRAGFYPQIAKAAIDRLLQDDVPVIVRILLMPRHGACCHIPSLKWLAERNAANLFVSLRNQYAPDWKISPRDGALAGRVAREEAATVLAAARDLGLNLVFAESGAG